MVKQFRAPLVFAASCLLLCAFATTRGQETKVRDPKAASPPAAAKTASTVELHLKIRDAASGFTLEAKKDVPAGTSGFDAIRHIVVVDYKHFPGLGAFVTGLCGIEPPKDHFWALYVDGVFSDKGISSIKLDADTKIEWKTQAQ